jgi:hypothetical protein
MVSVGVTVMAVASFFLSIYTLWVTQLRFVRLRMTQPSSVSKQGNFSRLWTVNSGYLRMGTAAAIRGVFSVA